MPKATIHEHRDLLRTKYEVGLSCQRRSTPPTTDLGSSQERNHPRLGGTVAALRTAAITRERNSRLTLSIKRDFARSLGDNLIHEHSPEVLAERAR
ncbi:MAG TPA: hypothetical protein VF614_04065 [Chthoniobacteraceae bacterium]|jgi:hypothetical protein